MKKTKLFIAGLLACASVALAGDVSTTTGLDPSTPWIETLHQIDTNTTVAAAVAARLAVPGVVLGDNVSTFLGTPTSANLLAALTTKTGTGNAVFGSTPTIATPVISGGLTASGSGANTFASSTGTFITSTGANTFKGSAMNFDAVARPTSDDGAALGDTTHNWSDLFLATGAVLNYANGNVVVTHSSGILTMGTGELRITTPGTNAASVPTLGSTSVLTNKTLTTPVISTGLTASGSTSNDFSGSTGTFKTSTGATTVGGSLAVVGTISATTDTRSGAGAVSVTKLVTKVTSTGTLDALTLADGVDGQIKVIVHDVAGVSARLTPTTKTGFTTITFTNAGETATLIFVTTRGWMILALNGAVAA